MPIESLKERMWKLVKDTTHKDVEFIVGGSVVDTAVTINAHKSVLAVNSPVFSTMFSGPLKETENTIEVTDITPKAFQNMLRFMYTDECMMEDHEEIFETYTAADKYLVAELKERCLNYLPQMKIKSSTACIILENALKFNFTDLETRINEVIESKTREVFKSESFLNSKLETVMKILELNTFNVASELEVLQSVVDWAERVKTRTNSCSSLREIINPLLPNLCFKSILPHSFCTFINEYPDIFTKSEALCILSNLTKPEHTDAPEWCNLRRTRKATRNIQAVVSFSPEMLRFKTKRGFWINDDMQEFHACILVTNVKCQLLIHGIQMEWKNMENKQLEVCVNHIATSDYSLIVHQTYDAPTESRIINKKLCVLRLSFTRSIELEYLSSFWIYVKVTLKDKMTIRYQERLGEKQDTFSCILSNNDLCLPLVSELYYTKI